LSPEVAVPSLLLSIALLTVAYAGVHRLVREGRWWRRTRGPAQLPLAVLPWALLSPWWTWSSVPDGAAVRAVTGIVVAALAWKAATRDRDVVALRSMLPERAIVVACAVGVWLSPAFLMPALLLFGAPFSLWEHHATMPMRALMAIAAWLGLAALPPMGIADASALFWFLLTIQSSHYVITAIAKAWLGPKPWSWVTDNRIHYLAANAWGWGWARWLPWSTWRRVVDAVKPVERPAQGFAFGIEALAPLALLDVRLAAAFGVAWAGFHLGVFALSGLLFWEWVVLDLAIAGALGMLPASTSAAAFGVGPAVLSAAFLVAFPLRHKLWKPMPLGWWDTPLTQRMHWLAHGESGVEYEVYANGWGPHERLFGKVHGCFLAPRPVLTYHLGEGWKRELRDAIIAAGADAEALEFVRRRYGVLPRDEQMAADHVAFLHRFFWMRNEGVSPAVLPRWLRWAKAPGGQCFYGGDRPAYRGQERIVRFEVRYREEAYDGAQRRLIHEQTVLAADVDPDRARAAVGVRVPTPKDIDDLLLRHAVGRLIDLPDFGGGFVQADDGQRRAS
jgi:hypothetical protein